MDIGSGRFERLRQMFIALAIATMLTLFMFRVYSTSERKVLRPSSSVKSYIIPDPAIFSSKPPSLWGSEAWKTKLSSRRFALDQLSLHSRQYDAYYSYYHLPDPPVPY
mmetsp:Transcript_12409/g.34836  ORF Transcript_12409/g.34836 Transcript_12409/m.34836 type:complete len:108 (+) Transcript_12409:189-512(+)